MASGPIDFTCSLPHVLDLMTTSIATNRFFGKWVEFHEYLCRARAVLEANNQNFVDIAASCIDDLKFIKLYEKHFCGTRGGRNITLHHSRSRRYEKNLPMSWELLKGIEIKVLPKPLKIACLLYVCILYLLGSTVSFDLLHHLYVIVSHTTRDLY